MWQAGFGEERPTTRAKAQIDAGAFSRLVERVYAAGLDPSLWQEFLDAFDAEIDGAYLSLYGYDLRSGLALPAIRTRWPEDRFAAFLEYYSHRNPFPALILGSGNLRAGASEEYVPRDELKRTEFYNDFLAPQEDVGTGAGGLVVNEDGRLLIMSGQMRFRDEAKVPRLTALIDLLIPHLRQAFAMQRQLSLSRGVAEANGQLLDRAPSPVYLLDRSGRLAWCNREAAARTGASRLVAVAADGALNFADPRTQRQYERGLRALIEAPMPEAVPPFPVAGCPGWYASLMPLAAGAESDLADWLRDAPAVVLILSNPRPRPGDLWPAFVAETGLTPAEADLAEALIAGRSLSEHAERRGSSLHTVRTQAKAMFAKTGTRGQAELVARLARFFY